MYLYKFPCCQVQNQVPARYNFQGVKEQQVKISHISGARYQALQKRYHCYFKRSDLHCKTNQLKTNYIEACLVIWGGGGGGECPQKHLKRSCQVLKKCDFRRRSRPQRQQKVWDALVRSRCTFKWPKDSTATNHVVDDKFISCIKLGLTAEAFLQRAFKNK